MVLRLILILLFSISCVKKRDLSVNQVGVHIKTSPDGIHPTNDHSAIVTFIQKYTQKKLADVGLVSEKVEPLLLKELPNSDTTGTLFHYEILDGIKWDNQEPLLAKDVAFTMKILLCPLTNNSDIRCTFRSVIDSVKLSTTHPSQFTLVCKSKHQLNRDILREIIPLQKSFWDPENTIDSLSFARINATPFVSSAAIDEWFNNFNSSENAYLPEKLVGLGPYQVKEFEKGHFIKLTRKDHWWGDQRSGPFYDNYPKTIIFKPIADDAAAYLAIKNQEIDFTKELSTSKMIKLQQSETFKENYHSDFIFRFAYNYMGLNMRPDRVNHLPLFESKEVRRAIALLTPIDEIIEVIYYGKAQRQVGIVPAFKPSFNTSLTPIPYDVEKALALLKKNGWTDTDNDQILDKMIDNQRVSFSFKLTYAPYGSVPDIVFMMVESFKKAGIECIPNPVDGNTLFQKAANHDFDAFLAGWMLDEGYSDPTQLWSTESWATKGSNFTGFGNARSDSLIQVVNTTLDSAKHLKAFHQFQQLIYDEQPYAFLWSTQTGMAAHKRFDGTDFYRTRPNVSLGSFHLKTEGF